MSNTTKIILVVIIVLILVGIGALVRSQRSVQQSSSETLTTEEVTAITPEAAPPAGEAGIEASSPVPVDQSTGVPASETAEEQTTINYTETGFSPARMEVTEGTTVQFKNMSTLPVWPASNPHPTHNDYVGFDAKRALSQGQSYSFTFTKKGEWGFHNHSNPSETGMIIVK